MGHVRLLQASDDFQSIGELIAKSLTGLSEEGKDTSKGREVYGHKPLPMRGFLRNEAGNIADLIVIYCHGTNSPRAWIAHAGG